MRRPDMADGGDRPYRPASAARASPPTDRERFLTFALTAADMLLEVSPEGRIEFAAGAFQSRLGEPPEAWLGRPVESVVVLPDRAAFDGAFCTLLARDRLPPTSFRLSDPAGTPISIAGLRMPAAGGRGRFCLTVSSLPRQPLRPPPASPAATRCATRRCGARTEPADVLSLIEVAGPDGRPPQPGPVAALVDEALSAALPRRRRGRRVGRRALRRRVPLRHRSRPGRARRADPRRGARGGAGRHRGNAEPSRSTPTG